MNSNNIIAATLYFLRNIRINTLHKGDDDVDCDDDDDNNNNNNNNNTLKVKFDLEQATKVQRGNRCIALLFP